MTCNVMHAWYYAGIYAVRQSPGISLRARVKDDDEKNELIYVRKERGLN